jgi:hypothetical protein
MAIKNVKISSTTTTQIFVAPNQNAVTTMIFCNTSNDRDATLDVFAVPYGSNPSASTQIMNNVVIPATETFVLDTERLILELDDAIYAQASEDQIITATISTLSTA